VGDGARHGLRVRFVDEGEDLRGTAGALRLALDEGALEESFLLTYGDSFLPIDFAAVFQAFTGVRPAGADDRVPQRRPLGQEQRDLRRAMVTLYDKQRQGRPAADFTYIDYGSARWQRRVIADEIAPGRRGGPGDAVQRAERSAARWRAWR
jgi:hypothetical protein